MFRHTQNESFFVSCMVVQNLFVSDRDFNVSGCMFHVSCLVFRLPFMCPNRRYLIPRFRIMVRPGALLIVPRRPSRRIMDVSLVAPLLVSGLVSTKAAAVTLGVTPRTTYRHLAAVSTPRPVHGLPKTWCLQQINWMQWWGVR